MKKEQTNFFKDFFGKIDGIFALAMGALFGIGCFLSVQLGFFDVILPTDYVEPFNMGMNIFLLFVTALFLLFSLPGLTKKYSTKADVSLVTFLGISLACFGLSVGYDQNTSVRVIVWTILAVLGLILLVVRALKITETNEESTGLGTYFVNLYKAFNPLLFIISGLVLGLVFGIVAYYANGIFLLKEAIPAFADFAPAEQIMIVGSVPMIILLIILALSIFKSLRKLNAIDYIVHFCIYVVIGFASCISLAYYENRYNRYIIMTLIAVWLMILFGLLAITYFRALGAPKQKVKTDRPSSYYFSEMAKKLSLPTVVLIAAITTFGFFHVDYCGINNITEGAFNLTILVITAIILVLLAITIIISLFKKQMVETKVNTLDICLEICLFGGVFVTIPLVGFYALYKVLVIGIAFLILLFILAYRAKKVYEGLLAEDIPYVPETEAEPIAEEIVEETVYEEPAVAKEEAEPCLSEEAPVEETVAEEATEEPQEEANEETVEETTIVLEEEPVVETVEETKVEPVVVPVSEGEETPVFRTIAKRTYINKLKFLPTKTKEYYSTLKNTLLQYGVTSRLTNKNETFRKRGLVAKMTISGKTLRLHLALDVEDERFEVTKYHQFSLGEKHAFKDVPFTVKVKSDLGCRRACDLIKTLCQDRKFRFKKNYEVYDFTKDIEIDGDAIFEKLGITEHMVDSADEFYASRFDGNKLPSVNMICSLIPAVEFDDGLNHEDGESQNVYIETALKYVADKTISIDSLKACNEIPLSTQRIFVKMHEAVTEPITVICDDIDLNVAVAVLATHGKVFFYKKKLLM